MPVQSQQQLAQVYYNTYLTLNPNIVANIAGTDSYFKANAVSQIGANIIQDIQLLQNNIFPPSSSGVFLDKHAGNLGMTPRMGALPSQGIITLQTGTGGNTALGTVVISAGTLLTSNTTNNQYQTLVDVTITTGNLINTITLQVASVNLGTGTESPVADIWSFNTPITVAVGQVVSTAIVTNITEGSDIESDNLLAARIFNFSQNPRGGGSIGDYVSWCFLGDPSVTQATVITTPFGNFGILFPVILVGNPDPNYYIDGSVNNDFMPTPYPISRTALPITISNVQTYINGVRPINDNPNVLTVATYLVNGANLNMFIVTVALSPGLTLTTQIEVANGSFLTVTQLIQREFRRAIISAPLGGTEINTGTDDSPVYNQYILVSDIERIISQGLANSGTYQGNYASILVSIQIDYFYNSSPTPTYIVPVPSLNSNNLFYQPPTFGALPQVQYVYDIDVSIITVQEIG